MGRWLDHRNSCWLVLEGQNARHLMFRVKPNLGTPRLRNLLAFTSHILDHYIQTFSMQMQMRTGVISRLGKVLYCQGRIFPVLVSAQRRSAKTYNFATSSRCYQKEHKPASRFEESLSMASALWSWARFPLYFGGGLIGLAGSALYYWQK